MSVILGRPLVPQLSLSPVTFHYTLNRGALITLFHPKTQSGGAIHLPEESASEMGKYFSELVAKFTHLNAHPANELKAKIITSPEMLKPSKALLSSAGIELTGEQLLGTELTDAYFYSDSGRLRSGKVSVVPEKPLAVHRVLIVDDSTTMRKLLREIFAHDPALKVVGTASSSIDAEKLIRELKPDVITLDLQMPGMNGAVFLEKYLPIYPIPTVVITSMGADDGTMVLRALQAGAVDYIQKPVFSEIQEMTPVLCEKVKMAARSKLQKEKAPAPVPKAESAIAPNVSHLDLSLPILIGASTGGTVAIKKLLSGLPKQIPPILIVQHIPALFSRTFAESLDQSLPFRVKEAEDGELIEAGKVLIAPGGWHMIVQKSAHGQLQVRLNQEAPFHGHRPSVDHLFHSAASSLGKKCVGILLTGMGSDGALGLRKLKDEGARTIAQDEESSVVFGMPNEAIKLGAADLVVHIDKIAEQICNWLESKKVA